MLFSNSSIYNKEWLDVIFAGRNKSYGAYELRMIAPKAEYTALGIVLAAVLGVCAIGYASSDKGVNNPPELPKDRVLMVELKDEVPLEIEKPLDHPKEHASEKPQQVAQDVPARELIKFTEINPSDKTEREDLAEHSTLMYKKTMLANVTMKGIKGGELITTGAFGREKKEGANRGSLTGDLDGSITGNDKTWDAVEVMPEPKGGMKAFIQWVADNYSFPQGAIDAEAKGIIQVSFVVEKDGTLSSFTILKDMGYGTGNAAVNLLGKAKKWNPGIQNGRPVRVSFTMPIRLQVNPG